MMQPSVAGALGQARRLGVARLEVQLLLAAVLHRPRSWLLAHDDAPLDAGQAAQVSQALHALADGVPLAYLTGRHSFCGLELAVGPGVLVPRPETEDLVRWALECLQECPQAVASPPPPPEGVESTWGGPALTQGRAAPQVVDLGTGSGAIALAIRSACPGAEVSAVERSEDALAIARANGARLGLAVQWLAGDWWAPLAGRRFDLVLANPPYIAAGDPHLPALRHEPAAALVAGADGLDDLRRIVAGAPAHLRPGGWLLLEHGHDQGPALRALLAAAGFEAVATRRDLAGLDRCSGGRLGAPAAG